MNPSGAAPERQIRFDLAALFRWTARLGWDDHIHTHLSARVPAAADRFLLHPLGLTFAEVTASSLIVVGLDGEAVEPTDRKVNFGAVTIHGAVYGAKPEAACVIHLHTIPAVAVSAQEDGLLPLSQFAMMLGDDIAYHDFAGLESTEDDRRRLVSDLGDKHVMILRNHGTLVWAETVAGAFSRCYWLERACAAQIAAQAGGARLRQPSPAVAKATAEQGARFDSSALAWQAVVRTLDASEPDYRN
jgi:ribulose-5-phosphate 4-epimerase/fuculose-1-phosphate aldolase